VVALGALLGGACDGSGPVATDAASPPVDAATSDGASSDGASSDGGLPLFAQCTANADCASGICHYYPARATSYCTKPCTTDGDCPPPSPGCTLVMGVCRVP
jgi:hypothetical protein